MTSKICAKINLFFNHTKKKTAKKGKILRVSSLTRGLVSRSIVQDDCSRGLKPHYGYVAVAL